MRLRVLIAVWLVAGCGDNLAETIEPYQWDLPEHFPLPAVPADNPMTEAKVELGRHLFYDERLSADQTASCATCHQPERAFAGVIEVDVGHGATARRNVPSLANVGYMSTLTWASHTIFELEELEISAAAFERLAADPVYDDLRSEDDVRDALACFLRTIISGETAFDTYTWGRDPSAFTESEARGFEMFWSQELSCFGCHETFMMTRATRYAGVQGIDTSFANTGLYNVDGAGAYPASDRGLVGDTGEPEHEGWFRTPSLRNVALTGPYYHDGSGADLDAVIDDYAAGGRVIDGGPNAGDGRANPHKSELIGGFELTESERADLKAFLHTLTDPNLASNPRLSNPWIQ